MTRTSLTTSVLMFGAPFLLLGACYAALPLRLPVLLNPIAGAVMRAPKSAFTVFRVPLMNLTHGLMAIVMLSRTGDFADLKRRTAYSGIFMTLLFTIALKSDLEALGMSALAWPFGPFDSWFTGATALVVVGGLGLAFVSARNVPIPWPELRLSNLEKITLAALFAIYLAAVGATLIVLHRA
jgi:hypothetical protein